VATTKQIRSRRLPIICRDLQSRQRIENNQDYYCRRPEKVLLILSAHGGDTASFYSPHDAEGLSRSHAVTYAEH